MLELIINEEILEKRNECQPIPYSRKVNDSTRKVVYKIIKEGEDEEILVSGGVGERNNHK